MSEIERIRKMAADGTITSAEADRLIALLEDIDRAEAQVDAVESAAADTAAADTASADAAPPDGAEDADLDADRGARHDARHDARRDTSHDARHGRAEARAERAAQRVARSVERAAATAAEGAGRAAAAMGEASAGRKDVAQGLQPPAGLAWFRIPTLAGDFDIDVDPSLDAPEVEGPEGVRVRETEEGYVLELKQSGSFFERLINGKIDRDFRIRLPENVGVDLQVKAGDIDMRDVPYLKGHVLAGDIQARGLAGIDLKISAGDLDIELAPTGGSHRILMTAGDIDVRLGAASDVRVEGHVSIGDASMPDGFDVQRRGVGETFRGTIGLGTASLEIRQSTGDTNVSVGS